MSEPGSQELLISLVRERPWIWNPSHKDHKDRTKKWNSWNAISKIMNMPAHLCKKKWKNLKDSYAKSKRDDRTKSKSGSGRVPTKRWVHRETFDAMMREVYQHRRSSENLDQPTHTDETVNDDGDDVSLSIESKQVYREAYEEICLTPVDLDESMYSNQSTASDSSESSKDAIINSAIASLEKTVECVSEMLNNRKPFESWLEYLGDELRNAKPKAARSFLIDTNVRIAQMQMESEACNDD